MSTPQQPPVDNDWDAYYTYDDEGDARDLRADACSRDDHSRCTNGPFTYLGESGHWSDLESDSALVMKQLINGTSPYL